MGEEKELSHLETSWPKLWKEAMSDVVLASLQEDGESWKLLTAPKESQRLREIREAAEEERDELQTQQNQCQPRPDRC